MTAYAVTVSDGLEVIVSGIDGARGVLVNDVLNFGLIDSLAFGAGAALSDLLVLHEDAALFGRYPKTISNVFLFQELLLRAYPATLTSGLGLHDLTKVKQALTVIDQLKLHDAPGALAAYATAILDNVRFHHSLLNFFAGALPIETTGFSDEAIGVYQATSRLNESVALASLLGGSLLFRIDLTDATDFDDAEILRMIYKGDSLLDGFRIWASYVDPGGGFITWAINTRTSAVTEYSNFAFNSYCKMGHRYLGADSAGLWALDGVLDDTRDIPTRIKGGWMQLAGSHFTSFKAAYLGVRTSDTGRDFFFKLHAGDGREYVYAVVPQRMQTTKVNMGKGLRSRYFSFELVTDGADYDLDSIEFVPISSQRRV